MAVTLRDGSSGLLAQNKLRSSVEATITNKHFTATMDLLQSFKTEKDEAKKKEIGIMISDVAFWAQWLIRGVLFEGKLHWEMYCQDVVGAPLAKIAFAANAALGRHQIEFVYDDYTLKAASFPPEELLENIDYDSSEDILKSVALIETPVGFNDMAGGAPEHNFRHNHSLMEWQMKAAFQGLNDIIDGKEAGWDLIVESARRANRVFHTMLTNTPPDTYPAIRLPIKGVRGACGTVYHNHGVFYEGVGTQEFANADGKLLNGLYINNEWGQTGANSSMYKVS
jgi:hypothetical protein